MEHSSGSCASDTSCPESSGRRQRPDSQLIAQIRGRRDGWRAAVDELVRRHERWVFSRCLMHLGNHHDAQDAAQEVLLRALQGLARFKGESEFRTWLYVIIRNACRTLALRRSRHMLSIHLQELIRLHVESLTRAADAETEIAPQVSRTLEDISTDARQVLELRFFRDYSLEEIASHLGIGLSAAKMRLYRAIDSFRTQYTLATKADAALNT